MIIFHQDNYSPTYITSMHEAEELMRNRNVDAILRIPSNFSTNLYNQRGSVQLILNGLMDLQINKFLQFVENMNMVHLME